MMIYYQKCFIPFSVLIWNYFYIQSYIFPINKTIHVNIEKMFVINILLHSFL